MKASHTAINRLLFLSLFSFFFMTIADSKTFTLTEPTQHTTSSQSPQDHACLVFEPASSIVMVGDTFTLTIQVQADSHQVDGVAAYINFDPSHLQVEQMTLTSAFPLILEDSFSNITGTIDIAAGTISNFPTGTFDFAELELAAIEPTPLTSLAFNFTPPRESNITFAGNSILACHTDATIAILIPTATPSNTPTAIVSATNTPTAITSVTTTPTAITSATTTPTAITSATNTPTAITSATNTPSNQLTTTPTAITSATTTPTAITSATTTPTAITSATPTSTNKLTQTPTQIPNISNQRKLFLPILLKNTES